MNFFIEMVFVKGKGRHKDKEAISCSELEKSVFSVKPVFDSNGRYIPYCDKEGHQGVSLRQEICEKLNCKYYKKLYINGY